MKELQDRYNNEELPEDELSAEETRLLEATLDEGFKNRWATKLSAKGIHRQEAKIVRLPSRRHWLAIAAALLILLFASLWLFFPASGSSNVLADADLPYAFPGTGRNGENVADQNWQGAVHAYEQGQFDQALELASALPPTTPQLDFFRGMCRFHASPPDYAGALTFFKNADSPDEVFFYSALAHLHLKQKDEARTALEKTLASKKLQAKFKAKAEELKEHFF